MPFLLCQIANIIFYIVPRNGNLGCFGQSLREGKLHLQNNEKYYLDSNNKVLF